MEKYIGVLGGLGFKATLLAYERLNLLYQKKMGADHTCPIQLLSIDFKKINALLPTQMDAAAQLLQPYLKTMDEYNVIANIMLNNTLHQAFDLVAPSLKLKTPFGHIGHLVQDSLQKSKAKQVVLIGTKYTMNAGYFHSFIEPFSKVVLPTTSLQNEIEKLRKIYFSSEDKVLAKKCYQQLEKMNVDRIVIACTELSLAFENLKNEKWIDTIDLQCEYAVDILLNSVRE